MTHPIHYSLLHNKIEHTHTCHTFKGECNVNSREQYRQLKQQNAENSLETNES